MWLIACDSFLTGTFCSTAASYETNKKYIELPWMCSLASSFFPQSKKSGLYLKELFFRLGCLSLKVCISSLEQAAW